MKKHKFNFPLISGVILLIIIGTLIFVSLFNTPYDPTQMNVRNRLASPSLAHPFGTDQFGRDVLSRVMVGGQVSIAITFGSVSAGMLLGVMLGSISGYRPGVLDEVLMRIADVMYSFPAILLALLAVAIYGSGEQTVIIAIAVANVPIFMRITRNNFLSIREQQYVLAAKSVGVSGFRMVVTHLLPNTLHPIMTQASVSFASAILAEASLSYLGVGIQPPDPSWGRLLKEAQGFAGLAPWNVIAPGIAIAASVLAFNLLSEGLKNQGI